jgi:FkbM family methyltransferase
VTPGSNIIIADGAQDFAEQCLRIWRDEPLRRQIDTGARSVAEQIYLSSAHKGDKYSLWREQTSFNTRLVVEKPRSGMIKSTIVRTVRKVAPTYYKRYKRRPWKRRWSAMRSRSDEQELYLAPLLCDPKKTSIDIGAGEDIYTVHILNSSHDCLAFEPLQRKAFEMAQMVEALSLPVRIEAVALSDVRGEATLRILKEDEWRSTIERDNPLENSEPYEMVVATQRLDDYDLDAVAS